MSSLYPVQHPSWLIPSRSDPDIQHIPFFAITPVFFKSLYSSYYKRELTFDRFSHYLIVVQHRLFYLVMSFARFNLYRLSYEHLWTMRNDPIKARGGRWSWWLEVVGLGFWWCWYGNVLKGCGSWQTGLMYLLVSNMVPSPLHVQVMNFLNSCIIQYKHLTNASFSHSRLSSLISHARPQTWGRRSPSLTANCARRQT